MGWGRFYRRSGPIYVQQLKLTNFRNYSSAELRLEPGATLIQGYNGHGKSNLLEAVHTLSVSRSTRASVELELVNNETLSGFPVHAQLAGTVAAPAGELRLQIDYAGSGSLASPGRGGNPGVHKTLRVNGVRRRSAQFVRAAQGCAVHAGRHGTYGRSAARAPPLHGLADSAAFAQLSRRLAGVQQGDEKQRNALLRAIREGKSRPVGD